MCDNLFNGTFPEEQEYVQTVVANVEMVSNLIKQVNVHINVNVNVKTVSNLIKQVNLDIKNSPVSRFPVSSLHSSLDPGATEQEGSR